MHRLGPTSKALKSYGSHSVKFNSTVATDTIKPGANPKRIVTTWGNVVIPSREELLKRAGSQSTYKPDLSYLAKAPAASLASRLARPQSSSTTVNKASPDTATMTQRRKEARLARETLPKPSVKAPIDVAANTQKRKEERLAREVAKAAVTSARVEETNAAIRNVRSNALKLGSGFESLLYTPGPLPLERAKPKTTPSSSVTLSASALKRRADRLRREKAGSKSGTSVSQTARRTEPRQTMKQRMAQMPDSIDLEEKIDESELNGASDEELHEQSAISPPPLSSGPEAPTNLEELFGRVHHAPALSIATSSTTYSVPPQLVSSFIKGDYSKYVTQDGADYATPPRELGPVKRAQVALSHRFDYSIPQRKHAIDIIQQSVTINQGQTAQP
ncbi:hypothetical protein B0H34DRAFT_792113 [Crassisporium funariophilum]|nr:hypothetical protein B0H34DRAFT_792113 [Crassisporium funariophilum]